MKLSELVFIRSSIEEVESSVSEISIEMNIDVIEFTVAPQVNPPKGELPFHEWFIEFNVKPIDMNFFTQKLDEKIQTRNSY